MRTYIVFTPEQAAVFKGSYGDNAELLPVPLVSGEFVVGNEVLEDINYSSIKADLMLLPQRIILESEFKK